MPTEIAVQVAVENFFRDSAVKLVHEAEIHDDNRLILIARKFLSDVETYNERAAQRRGDV